MGERSGDESEVSQNYAAADVIQVLKGLECVRKRPGMYIGDTTNGDGINHIVRELVANAVDQFLLGNVSKITVEVKAGTITVSDDGSLFPFTQKDHSGRYETVVECYLSQLHFSATADEHAPHIHLSRWGVGLAVLNVVSKHFLIESSDGQNKWSQAFGKGKILAPVSCQAGSFAKGTKLTLKLDPEIFECLTPKEFDLRKGLLETACLFPGIAIAFDKEIFHASNGLLDLGYLLLKPPAEEGFIKLFHHSGQAHDIEYQLAILGACDGDQETEFRSWANGRPTIKGTHVQGVQAALSNTDWRPQMALVHIIMHEPKYAGPTRDILCLKKVSTVLEEELTPLIKQFLKEQC